MEPGNMSGAMPEHIHKESGDSAHAQHATAPRHDAQASVSSSEVSAHTTFPRAGLYKVWAQFQRAGHVITVPFVVRTVQPEVEDEGGQN